MFGDDDVARNIHNEMQRDAMPSKEEAEAEHRRYLQDTGCQHDGCHENHPDKLSMCKSHFTHSCSAVQHAEIQLLPFCDEHKPDTSREAYIQNRLDQIQKQVDAGESDAVFAVVYECDIVETFGNPETPTETNVRQVGTDDDGEPIYEAEEMPIRYAQPTVSINVTHRCGDGIEEVHVLERAK